MRSLIKRLVSLFEQVLKQRLRRKKILCFFEDYTDLPVVLSRFVEESFSVFSRATHGVAVEQKTHDFPAHESPRCKTTCVVVLEARAAPSSAVQDLISACV